MTDGNGPRPDDATVQRLTPDEAFGLLGNETRFAILQALHDADGPRSFSDLRESVGVADSGRFNYHLGELAGRFVRSTDDGYRLAAAGRRVVGAVLSGGVTKELDGDPVATDAACQRCGATMTARFRTDGVAIECPDCGMQYTDPDVPPGLVEGREGTDVATAVDLWGRRNQASAGYGLCPSCDGQMDESVVLPGEDAAPDWLTGEDLDATVVYDCGRCGQWWHAVVPLAALTHPAVMGFHHEHGIDLRETPTWELPWLAIDAATVTDRDPLRVALTIALDGETLSLTFDRELSVVAEHRA